MSSPFVSPGGKRLEQLKVTELKDELRKRGLSPSGVKKDLLERLKSHLSESDQPAIVSQPEIALAPTTLDFPESNAHNVLPQETPPPDVPEPPAQFNAAQLVSDTGDDGAFSAKLNAPSSLEETAPPAPGNVGVADTQGEGALPAQVADGTQAVQQSHAEATAEDAKTAVRSTDVVHSKASSGQEDLLQDLKAVPDSACPPSDGAAVPLAVPEGKLEPEITGVTEVTPEEAEAAPELNNVQTVPGNEAEGAETVVPAVETGLFSDTAGTDSSLAVKEEAAKKQTDVEMVEAPGGVNKSVVETQEVVKDEGAVAKDELAEGGTGAELPDEGGAGAEQPKEEDEEMVPADEGPEGGLLVQLEAPGLELPDVEEQESQREKNAGQLAGQKRQFDREEGKASDESKRIRRWGSSEVTEAGSRREPAAPPTGSGRDGAGPTRPPVRSLSGRQVVPIAGANGQVSKERTVPPSKEPATASVRVDNLVRPFVTKHLQELLGKTGKVEKFWIDNIKTHCYVTYSNENEATATRQALYNVQWPEQGGKLLAVRFVPPEEVDAKLGQNNGAAPAVTPTAAVPPPAKPVPVDLQPTAVRAVLPRRDPEPALPTLDDLFKKTKSKPEIYFLPLTDDQVASKLASQQKPLISSRS